MQLHNTSPRHSSFPNPSWTLASVRNSNSNMHKYDRIWSYREARMPCWDVRNAGYEHQFPYRELVAKMWPQFTTGLIELVNKFIYSGPVQNGHTFKDQLFNWSARHGITRSFSFKVIFLKVTYGLHINRQKHCFNRLFGGTSQLAGQFYEPLWRSFIMSCCMSSDMHNELMIIGQLLTTSYW